MNAGIRMVIGNRPINLDLSGKVALTCQYHFVRSDFSCLISGNVVVDVIKAIHRNLRNADLLLAVIYQLVYGYFRF